MIAGMVGAIAPDLDLLYFYLIDHRAHNHHSYWTHYPSVWLGLLLIALVLRYPMRWPRLGSMAVIFSLNGLIHMVLDSVAGYIHWLAPFEYKAYGWVTLSSPYQIWWLNFVFHWTFLIELSLMTWAILVWRRHVPG
jgi:inner membrane protein